jgi:hypothetical protein
MYLLLSEYSRVSVSYDANDGQQRCFVLSGLVDNPYIDDGPDFSAPHFNRKPVRVEIYAPPDPDWLCQILGDEDAKIACGLVQVNANVDPDIFKLEDEVVEDEPIIVWLRLDADVFEALRHQAAEAHRERRILGATLRLVGSKLPETDSHFIFLKDLDVSERQVFAVGSFEISNTRYIQRFRGRVRQVERKDGERYGTRVSVLLTEVRYKIDAESATYHGIACEGRIINGRGKAYEGISADVTFNEHETNSFDELPDRSVFGEFEYGPADGHSSAHFGFHLRHLPEDARDVLIPMLNLEGGSHVVLEINLNSEEDALLSATEHIDGEVRYYNLAVRRRLVDYAAVLKRLNGYRDQLEQRDLEGSLSHSRRSGTPEDRFQRVRNAILSDVLVSDWDLNALSIEQIDALIDEIGR